MKDTSRRPGSKIIGVRAARSNLIFVIFSPQMYFLGPFSLHMKARQLWQNLPTILKISQNFPKFPKISPHDNFFSTNIICDICDKYELCKIVIFCCHFFPGQVHFSYNHFNQNCHYFCNLFRQFPCHCPSQCPYWCLSQYCSCFRVES